MDNTPSNPVKKNPLIKSAIIVAAAVALGKAIGFAREIALAAFYGAGTVSDAFILAFTIPDILLYFISFSTASSYIATYNRVKDKTAFTRNIMTCLLLIGLLISSVFTLIPGALVKLFAYRIAPDAFELAVYFVRCMIWSAGFMLLSEIFGAYLEMEGDFVSVGIRGVWRNLTVILGVILGAVSGRSLIIALAPVAGNALCMLYLAARCRKRGYAYRPYLNIRSPELKQILILTGPMLLSTAATEINQIISRNFAASLQVGAISSLNYAGRVRALFISLIGQALVTVLFPHMSRLAASGDMVKLKSCITRGVMYVTAVMLPVCVGVTALAQPGVRILFQRGSFTAADTLYTASCLRMYAPLIISGSINPLLMRAFYAVQSTRLPAGASIFTVIANAAFIFLLINPLGAEGLALAGSLSSILTTALLLVLLRKRLGRLGLGSEPPELVKIILATSIMGAGVWLGASALPLMLAPVWQSALFCAALAAAAALLYIALLLILKSKTIFSLFAMAINNFYLP